MSRKILLFAAAFFTLFTCLGHSIGTLLPHDQPESIRLAQMMMDATFKEMPFGPPKSLGQMAYGGNVIISLYLFVAGWIFILSARQNRFVPAIVGLNSAGMLACGVFSVLYFFPLPAICTGLAGLLGFLALRSS